MTALPPARWALPGDRVLAALGTSRAGLSSAAAAQRLAEAGPNEVTRESRRRPFDIVRSQFANRLVILLVAAAGVSLALGERVEAAVILAIVVLNAALGFVQEYRAERALGQLRRFVSHTARVRRDGGVVEIPAAAVVPGDVVLLAIGDMVPADMRLLAADDFACDEAALTGESLPAQKDTAPRAADRDLLQERSNEAFRGTTVASGYGEGVVVATGRNTVLGGTAAALSAPHPETDFQRNIRRFSDLLFKITLLMTAFVFLANALLAKGLFDSFLFAVALAVGITPEALPVIVTIALSRGALRMAKAKVIIKRLVSVEDLGNIDVLCCDKTGTLTQGEVALADYRDLANVSDRTIVRDGLLCSAPEAAQGLATPGSSIDRAVWQSEAARLVDDERRAFRIVDRNEFDFERRRMSAVAEQGGRALLVVKGAAEAVLDVSTNVILDGRPAPLDAALRERAARRVAEWEAAGYRVIAVAEKAVAVGDTSRRDERELTLRGWLLFLDPPKAGAAESLALLRELGVDIKVMSGDSPVITRRICHEVGLVVPEDRIITGRELEHWGEDELRAQVVRYQVFARLSPEQKHRLVTALRAADGGRVVGFLGDGINDAPALRVADVGIAVDSGTGIAKEAADVILLEKSLAVLADGIMEGRRTFGNIIKYILNTISANFGNMSTVAVSSLFLRFIPLLPSQILLNNLLSDLPLVAISTDRVDAELLRRPRHWHLGVITRFMVMFGLLSAAFDLVLILGLAHLVRADVALFRTVWFVESACSEILVTFAIRTRLAFFRSAPAVPLLVGSVAAAALALALPFLGAGQRYFGFTPIPRAALVLLVGVLAAYFLSAELAKRPFFRRFVI